MNLCVIPARGGSKRIPQKNIKFFCGKPIIIWSIEKAIKSKCFDRIIVSTDDQKIIEIVRDYQVEVPFIRPKELADDYTSTVPVVAHAIKWQIENAKAPDFVCCLYPTAPFVEVKTIKSGLKCLKNFDVDYVFAATDFAYPVQRSFIIKKNKRLQMTHPEHLKSRSQDLDEVFHDAGQFYWGLSDTWLKNKPIITENSSPIFVPRTRAIDIDTIEDWEIAEKMFEVINNK